MSHQKPCVPNCKHLTRRDAHRGSGTYLPRPYCMAGGKMRSLQQCMEHTAPEDDDEPAERWCWRRTDGLCAFHGRRVLLFDTEAKLCDDFMLRMRRNGWAIYAEWADWDFLMVRRGVQIGVQAKLNANVKVLAQALDPDRSRPGPHVHGILVPDFDDAFRTVASRLHLAVFSPLTLDIALDDDRHNWPVWRHPEPHALPDHGLVPELRAGHSAPVRMTPNKIRQVKMAMLLREQGYVTSRDFKRLGVSINQWRIALLKSDGIVPGTKRLLRLVVRKGVELPDQTYPHIANQLRDRKQENS